MTDSQQKKLSERAIFFSKKILISPKNGASEEATIFYFKNIDSPQKLSERRRIFSFQRKKRNIDVILGGKKKLLSPDKNEAAK